MKRGWQQDKLVDMRLREEIDADLFAKKQTELRDRVAGLSSTKKSYQRLKRALKRLRAVTVTYELTWYSRQTQAVEPVLITGILANAKLVFRCGRRTADALPDSYVQWTGNFYRSLQEGNLTDLDLD
jgi:hypothetical protein